jgi:small subunit ribosomal protein S21
MIRVRVRSNESVQQLIKRFNKLCEKEGLTRDIKRSAYYEKPGERRRRKERKSRKRVLAATRL